MNKQLLLYLFYGSIWTRIIHNAILWTEIMNSKQVFQNHTLYYKKDNTTEIHCMAASLRWIENVKLPHICQSQTRRQQEMVNYHSFTISVQHWFRWPGFFVNRNNVIIVHSLIYFHVIERVNARHCISPTEREKGAIFAHLYPFVKKKDICFFFLTKCRRGIKKGRRTGRPVVKTHPALRPTRAAISPCK